jgi:ubiquinone/menaquinone biosynthesis C-methylase UbiE
MNGDQGVKKEKEVVQVNPNVCPWWIGWFLASSIRKLYHNPNRILGDYVKQGMKVADIGAALGFFSIPMAKMVGVNGEVVCFDVQESMLLTLKNRLYKYRVSDTTRTHKSQYDYIGLDCFKNNFDFVLAFAVVHEVRDQNAFFKEIYMGLTEGGRMLISEPKGHVSKEGFDSSIDLAKSLGFIEVCKPKIKGNYSVLLERMDDLIIN